MEIKTTKLCPFKKEKYTYYASYQEGTIETNVKEQFMPCIGVDCMAWDSRGQDCRFVMNRSFF